MWQFCADRSGPCLSDALRTGSSVFYMNTYTFSKLFEDRQRTGDKEKVR